MTPLSQVSVSLRIYVVMPVTKGNIIMNKFTEFPNEFKDMFSQLINQIPEWQENKTLRLIDYNYIRIFWKSCNTNSVY